MIQPNSNVFSDPKLCDNLLVTIDHRDSCITSSLPEHRSVVFKDKCCKYKTILDIPTGRLFSRCTRLACG